MKWYAALIAAGVVIVAPLLIYAATADATPRQQSEIARLRAEYSLLGFELRHKWSHLSKERLEGVFSNMAVDLDGQCSGDSRYDWGYSLDSSTDYVTNSITSAYDSGCATAAPDARASAKSDGAILKGWHRRVAARRHKIDARYKEMDPIDLDLLALDVMLGIGDGCGGGARYSTDSYYSNGYYSLTVSSYPDASC